MKRSLSIVLASVLFANTTASAGVTDMVLSNVTPSKQVTLKDAEGNTVKTMYYSGGYYFRFNANSTPEPLWNFSPPEIEAGCNGFNLKGMFMSLLGLDQFGAMLQNAGTSLAWGVAVGLIYSLPGVASVFKMINQWAKDIQKLLSMSCQAGIAIGQSIGQKVGKGFDKSKFEKSLTFGMDGSEVSKFAQDGIKGTIKTLGLDGIDFEWESGFSFSGTTQASQKKKEDAISAAIQNLFGIDSAGGKIYTDYLKKSPTLDVIKAAVNSSQSPIFYKSISIDYSTGNSQFDSNDVLRDSVDSMSDKYTDITSKEKLTLQIFSYALLYNTVGDVGYSLDTLNKSIGKLSDVYKCSSVNPSTPSSCKYTKAEADKMLLEDLVDPSYSVFPNFVGKVQPMTGTELKSLIVDGRTDDNKDIADNFIAPNFTIIATKALNNNSSNFFIAPSDSLDNKKFFTDNFVGVKASSKCSLFNALKSHVGETKLSALTELNVSSADCSSTPTIAFDGVELYGAVLSKATDAEIAEGVNRLVNINTYLVTNSVLNSMASSLSVSNMNTEKLSSSAGNQYSTNNVSTDDRKDKLKTYKEFSEVIEKAKAELDKDYPDARESFLSAQNWFEKLAQKIRERTLRINNK